MTMLLKLTSLVASLLLAPSSAHFMWQNEGIRGEDAIVALTFAEQGGIAHAEREEFAERLQEDDVKAAVITSKKYHELDLEIDGKFVVGKIPKCYGNEYAMEGYVKWGVYSGEGEHKIPPMLIFEHTVASHMSRETIMGYKNKFGLYFSGTFSDNDKCSNDDRSLCITAKVVWDGETVPDADIMLNHGDGQAMTITTDANGLAYFSVPWADKRLYGRVNYNLDESGETEDGEHYDSISHWATASYEFSKTRMDLDSGEEKPFYHSSPGAEHKDWDWKEMKAWKEKGGWKESGSEHDWKEYGRNHDHVSHNGHDHDNTMWYDEMDHDSTQNFSLTIGCRGLFLVGLVSFIGSFLGFALVALVKNKMCNDHKVYATANQVDLDCEKQQQNLVTVGIVD